MFKSPLHTQKKIKIHFLQVHLQEHVVTEAAAAPLLDPARCSDPEWVPLDTMVLDEEWFI